MVNVHEQIIILRQQFQEQNAELSRARQENNKLLTALLKLRAKESGSGTNSELISENTELRAENERLKENIRNRPRQVPPRQVPPRQVPPRQAPPRQAPPRQAPPRQQPIKADSMKPEEEKTETKVRRFPKTRKKRWHS